jgi:uncharacterized Fe-S cluster protein YjdI
MAEVNEADAGQGGAGAPPLPTASNKLPPGVTREYSRPEITVHWYASRCIHSAACIRALPEVFDPGRRPWVDVTAAEPAAIAAAVERCPTGALQYVRADGSSETVPEGVQIVPVRNGPYFVRGAVQLTDPRTRSASGAAISRRARTCVQPAGRDASSRDRWAAMLRASECAARADSYNCPRGDSA